MVALRVCTPSPVKRRSLGYIISKKISFCSIVLKSGFDFLANVSPRRAIHQAPKLESLPLEILYNVLDFASADKLCKLCLTGQKMLNCISEYILSPHFSNRFSLNANSLIYDLVSRNELFTSYGRLVKAITTFYVKTEAISFLIKFFVKVHLDIKSEQGWYWLFAEVLQDSSQNEYYEFMKQLIDATDLNKFSEKILTSPSKMDHDEIILRNKISLYFFDGCLPRSLDFRLRLSAIIRLLSPPKMEFRLLLLIGAPISNGLDGIGSKVIDYLSAYITVIENSEDVVKIIGNTPILLDELLCTQDLEVRELRWLEMNIFNMLETITTYPEPWVLPNFAAFLLTSNNLARLAIFTRAIYGSISEAGLTLYCCFEVSESNMRLAVRDIFFTREGLCFFTAIKLGKDPQKILFPAAREVSSRCTIEICYTMFRECLTQANLRANEFFENVEMPTRELLAETLEIELQVMQLFKSMLDLIFA